MDSTITDIEKVRDRGDGMEQEEIEIKPKADIAVDEQTPKESTNVSSRPPLHRKDSAVVQENIHIRKMSSTSNSSNVTLPGLHALYRRTDSVPRSLGPVIPKGVLVPLRPRLVTPPSLLPEHKKSKPPKFIPYEPYPGAVNPIVPKDSSGRMTPNGRKLNKNNLDIAVLVNQMSTMRTKELGDDKAAVGNHSDEEYQQLKDELKKAQEERDYFKGQLKFQIQVNSELKSLLVASVGEDLQTHVNVLTEDKLQLARALLDTARNLSTHTEQIEFLAGQCEVWRSKFLASSVMIEELARWKADLTQKNEMLNESNRRLLHCTHQLREMQLEILRNLKFLAKIRYLNLPSVDVISLSAENLNVLQQMVLHSGVGMPDESLNLSSASSSLLCEAEKYAVQALDFISQPLMATDEAIRALFNQTHRSDILAMHMQ